jgi:hypothetical protein
MKVNMCARPQVAPTNPGMQSTSKHKWARTAALLRRTLGIIILRRTILARGQVSIDRLKGGHHPRALVSLPPRHGLSPRPCRATLRRRGASRRRPIAQFGSFTHAHAPADLCLLPRRARPWYDHPRGRDPRLPLGSAICEVCIVVAGIAVCLGCLHAHPLWPV